MKELNHHLCNLQPNLPHKMYFSLIRQTVTCMGKEVEKTTLIHRFLESQDSAKPTLALEYTFGHNLAKVNQSFYIFLVFFKYAHTICDILKN